MLPPRVALLALSALGGVLRGGSGGGAWAA